MHASREKLSKKLKTGIETLVETLVDQALFKLWIKTVKIMFE